MPWQYIMYLEVLALLFTLFSSLFKICFECVFLGYKYLLQGFDQRHRDLEVWLAVKLFRLVSALLSIYLISFSPHCYFLPVVCARQDVFGSSTL